MRQIFWVHFYLTTWGLGTLSEMAIQPLTPPALEIKGLEIWKRRARTRTLNMIVSYRVPQYQYLLYAEPASVIPASEASCGMGCRGLLLVLGVVLCYLLPGGCTAGGDVRHQARSRLMPWTSSAGLEIGWFMTHYRYCIRGVRSKE